ncbi:Carboxylic acid transporter [Dimargaris cristalligena]|nr:Carboxylic acid transporter [Dimargaris cristalligena]
MEAGKPTPADSDKKESRLLDLQAYTVEDPTSQHVNMTRSPLSPASDLSVMTATAKDSQAAAGENPDGKNAWALLRLMTPRQHLVFMAMFLGWALEAMDFYIASISLSEVAATFGISISQMAVATTVTLAMRPVGAILFGVLADRYGRRWPLIANVTICALISLCSGFAPNFAVFAFLRSIFGIAMGGEWALSAAMTMESLPPACHGLFSGILHQASPFGNIMAALLHLLVFPRIGWRPLYWISVAPAVFIILLRFWVPESPEWLRARAEAQARQLEQLESATEKGTLVLNPGEGTPETPSGYASLLFADVKQYKRTVIHMLLLISSLQFVNRSLTDLFPTIIQVQLKLPVSLITVALISRDLGTMIGSTTSGYLSQFLGRKRVMLGSIALALAFVPLFVFAPLHYQIILGAVFITIFIGGFNGVLAVFLHEVGPSRNRALFMGFTTQLANLITGATAQIEAALAERFRTKDGSENFTAVSGVFMTVFLCLTFLLLLLVKEGPKSVNATATDPVEPDSNDQGRPSSEMGSKVLTNSEQISQEIIHEKSPHTFREGGGL